MIVGLSLISLASVYLFKNPWKIFLCFWPGFLNLILRFQPHVNSYSNFISQLITIYKFYNIQLFCWHFFKISLWYPLSSFFYFYIILSVYLKSSICVFAYPFTNTWSSLSHELHNVLWKSVPAAQFCLCVSTIRSNFSSA